MHSFGVIFRKTQNFSIFLKVFTGHNFEGRAILKVAYLYLYNFLFIFQIFDSFLKKLKRKYNKFDIFWKKSTEERTKFSNWKKKNIQGILEV